MAYEMKTNLPPAPPDVLSPTGQPRLGAFHGSIPRVDWSARLGRGLRALGRRTFGHKRWQYGCIATGEVLCGFAVVDLGYSLSGFAFAVDLQTGRSLADVSELGVPMVSGGVNDRPSNGARATFRSPGLSVRLQRAEGTGLFQVEVSSRRLKLEAVMDAQGAPTPLSVVMPLRGGDVSATQKTVLMPVSGTLRAGNRRFELGGGWGGLDYTSGLHARDTAWRWAFALGRAADGTPVGLNLAEGLSDAPGTENALWVDGEPVPVAQPRFTWDPKNTLAPWHVRTDDGAIDLAFQPKGEHREWRNLLVVQTRFIQVAGVFSGEVRTRSGRMLPVTALPGLTEDQRVRW